MLNRIILIGRLTQEPEMKYTQSGKAVTNFTLAVDRPHSQNKETDFIRIVAWDKLAELVAQYLHKGRLAAVEGRLQIRQYEDKEGNKQRIAEVVADNVRFLDRAPEDNGNGNHSGGGGGHTSSSTYRDDPFADPFSGGVDITDDDLPF